MAIVSQTISADLETTVDPNDVRAWAVAAVDVKTYEPLFLSNNLDSFFSWLENKNTKCYFHNLRFDGEFLISWLLFNGYKHVDRAQAKKEFDTLITDDGLFYQITVVFDRLNKQYKKVTFYDSLKKLPFKVSEIAKAFKLKDSKLEIDYRAPRAKDHVLTENEKDYIIVDARIVAQGLHIQFEKGLKKMTIGADALSYYKDLIGKRTFEQWFPILPIELDSDIRRAYKGGYVYLNPIHQGKRGLVGMTYDVNSLYPFAMHSSSGNYLPYGYPMYFEGKYKPDEDYNLYIQHMKCTFELKPGHVPTVQLKNNRRYIETEYLTTSVDAMGVDEPVEMWLTNVDYQLLIDHYDIDNEEYINGYKFKSAIGMFDEYIDYWMEIKANSKGAMRTLAKLMLNNLYGKFAKNPKSCKKIPYLDDAGIVRYEFGDEELQDPVYTAMGAFITAYARNKTIRAAQENFDRFIYCDTDSLHITGHDAPDNLDVHPTRLGAWKHECSFTDSKFLRAKTYMETYDGVDHVTCAGMPDNIKELVTYDNFTPGSTFDGKLMPRRYKGGIILEPTTFTIK